MATLVLDSALFVGTGGSQTKRIFPLTLDQAMTLAGKMLSRRPITCSRFESRPREIVIYSGYTPPGQVPIGTQPYLVGRWESRHGFFGCEWVNTHWKWK